MKKMAKVALEFQFTNPSSLGLVTSLTQDNLLAGFYFPFSLPFEGRDGRCECSHGHLYTGFNNEVHKFN